MTGYGFTGPMTARGSTFAPKEEAAAVAATGGIRLPLMGAGMWLFWVLWEKLQ